MQTNNLEQFLSLIKSQNKAQLIAFYNSTSELEQLTLQQKLFQLGSQLNQTESFSLLAQLLLQNSTIPSRFPALCNANDVFEFYLQSLKTLCLFTFQDEQKRNVLHYLFANRGGKAVPPFNLIRALLLFESNLNLVTALLQRDHKGNTPLQTYLQFNPCFKELSQIELSAYLALLEVEQRESNSAPNSTKMLLNAKQLAEQLAEPLVVGSQRLLLLACYLNVEQGELVRQLG